MDRFRRLGLLSLMLLVGSVDGYAQAPLRSDEAFRLNAMPAYGTMWQADSTRDDPAVAAVVWGGASLGAASFLLGGVLAGVVALGCTSHEYCVHQAAIIGAAVGWTLGTALGVHLTNDRRGSLALDVLTAAGVGIAGAAIGAVTGDATTVNWPLLVAVPIAQLAATVAVERDTARPRSGAH